jgi:hypothetical protein
VGRELGGGGGQVQVLLPLEQFGAQVKHHNSTWGTRAQPQVFTHVEGLVSGAMWWVYLVKQCWRAMKHTQAPHSMGKRQGAGGDKACGW